jgi:hypothetical protein
MVLIELHRSHIGIAHPSAVRDYLLHYPDMADLVPIFCDIVREQLGVRTQLSLEVYIDPEIDDTYLILYARRACYETDFWTKIDEVSEKICSWLGKSSGWFVVTTDFKPL